MKIYLVSKHAVEIKHFNNLIFYFNIRHSHILSQALNDINSFRAAWSLSFHEIFSYALGVCNGKRERFSLLFFKEKTTFNNTIIKKEYQIMTWLTMYKLILFLHVRVKHYDS